jgi:hypothetical protein
MHLTALEEAEIIPGKGPDTRIKPLALTNGHGRYITVTPERTPTPFGRWGMGMSVKYIAVKFYPFHFQNGRSAVCIRFISPLFFFKENPRGSILIYNTAAPLALFPYHTAAPLLFLPLQ